MVAAGSGLSAAATTPRRAQPPEKRRRKFERARVLTPFAAALYRAGPLNRAAGA